MTDRRIRINRLEEWPELAGLEERLLAAAQAALDTGGLETAELSVTLLPAPEMRALNRAYHAVDAPTDVLAFDLGRIDEPPDPDAEDWRPAGGGGAGRASGGRRSMLGDLYVCPDVARRSARAEGVPERQEVARLVIHGVLHLLGHGHPEGGDRYDSEMFRLQERLLDSLSDESHGP